MKKKCDGCKALEKKLFGLGYYCGLDHPIEIASEIDGIPVKYKPLEECEKPKTITSYCELHLSKIRNNVNKYNLTLRR